MTAQSDKVSAFYQELTEHHDALSSYRQQQYKLHRTSQPSLISLFNKLRERLAPTPPPQPTLTPLTLSDGIAILRDLFKAPHRSKLDPWDVLAGVIARLSAEDIPLALDYAQDHTAAWPAKSCPYRFELKPPHDRVNTLARHLELWTNGEDEDLKIQQLLAPPPPAQQPRLDSLSIKSDTLTQDHLSALLQGTPCKDLKHLELKTHHLDGLTTEVHGLSRLEELTLTCDYKHPTPANELLKALRSPRFDALKRLTLLNHDWIQSYFDEPRLDRWPSLNQLEHLTIELDSSMATAVPLWAVQHNLLHLELKSVFLDAATVKDFVQQGSTSQLHTLQLSHNQISLPLLKQLCSAPFEALHTLSLSSNWLDDDQVSVLCDEAALPMLERLELSWCNLNSSKISRITRKNKFKQVKYLDLSGNNIDRDALIHLERLTEHGTLKELSLRSCTFTDREGYALMNSRAFKMLDHLNLDEHKSEINPELYSALTSKYNSQPKSYR
jgi:hypothetical protein